MSRPRFAYTWQIVDECQACNQDGQVQRGENVALMLDVTNIGTGKALDTFTIIRNAGDPNIFIEKGRFKLSPQTTQRNPQGRIWTHPVVLDGKLFLRDQELLHCYDVKGK